METTGKSIAHCTCKTVSCLASNSFVEIFEYLLSVVMSLGKAFC